MEPNIQDLRLVPQLPAFAISDPVKRAAAVFEASVEKNNRRRLLIKQQLAELES